MAVNIFLTIPGIAGESKSPGFIGSIEVQSFNWGVSTPVSISAGGGGGTGKAQASDVSIVKNFDAASPLLLKALTMGNVLPKITLSFVRVAGGNSRVTFLTYEFDTVFVDSIQDSASGEVPIESVSFAVEKVTVTYHTTNSTGGLGTAETFTWDFSRSVAP